MTSKIRPLIIIIIFFNNVRVVPELKEVSPDEGQGARGVFLDHLKILFRHFPDRGAPALKQGWVMQIPLCEEKIMYKKK